MERRELLVRGLGGLALMVFPERSCWASGTSEVDDYERFQELWVEARLSQYWSEDRRAYILCQRALATAPQDLDSGTRADIWEELQYLGEALGEAERDVAAQQAALKADPDDAERHFHLGFTLTRLGRDDEALAEYQAALRKPERMCKHCLPGCWNNSGWYHYRRGQYREALECFERACQLEDTSDVLQRYNSQQAAGNKMLAYSAMGMVPEAKATAHEYIARFGRVHWPERRALASIGIDADAMYIDLQHPPA